MDATSAFARQVAKRQEERISLGGGRGEFGNLSLYFQNIFGNIGIYHVGEGEGQPMETHPLW